MDGIQAAILNVMLKYIETWTEMRRLVATKYFRELSDMHEVKIPVVSFYINSSWDLFVINNKKKR